MQLCIDDWKRCGDIAFIECLLRDNKDNLRQAQTDLVI